MKELIQAQRAYFRDGKTLTIASRKAALRKLYRLLLDNEQLLADAIYADFRKSYHLTIENELSLVYGEINHHLRKLSRWTRPRYQRTNLVNFMAATRSVATPYGVCLVIGPWNYPYMLSLVPVVSALAAGNTVVLKPSEITSHSAAAMAELINTAFPREYVYVVQGGIPETSALLAEKFDNIFFTGSTAVGRIVMKAAAEHLTPLTLELGGKNPVIVMPDCNLKLAAKRIVWGKFHNNGMACVSPDHIYVHASIYDAFLAEVKRQVGRILGEDPRQSSYLPRMVNRANFERVLSLIDQEKVVLGGKFDAEDLYIEPTILSGVEEQDAIMQDEVFGPVMALIPYSDLDEVLEKIKNLPTPLMFYVFSSRIRKAKKLVREIPCGGAMINEVVLQFVNMDSSFGGLGESGMGKYHGRAGFDAFSHYKTIMRKANWFELFMKYPPFRKIYLRIYRSVLGRSARNFFR